MQKKPTIFQRLNTVLGNDNYKQDKRSSVNNYNISGDDVLFTTTDKSEYDAKALTLRQQNLLARQWRKANIDTNNKTVMSLNEVKLMYRDADIMDDFPEIGTAIDILAEESCYQNDTSNMINITSKSERIRNVLQDLFVNRLSVNITLPMVCRSMCKYGNSFMLLNIDNENGVMGWKQLPVHEMERYENGMKNPYSGSYKSLSNIDLDEDDSTSFVWVGQNEYIPYRNWQVAHFRLLYNSMFLPFGCSWLQKARRHFRMLSMMEDMMIVYRMERSIERRVFKINVGAIDDVDVPAYVDEIANNFKRTPVIDPMTGQLDLRKNFMPVRRDTPIPLLDGRTITIEQLANEYEEGKVNYVYSIQDDTHRIVPGKVDWCGKNYTAEKLYKITLDDGTSCVMAGEHEVIMRDGSKKRADEVSVDDSVMPFYREFEPSVKNDGFERVYNPNSGTYEPTHQLVALELPKEKGQVLINHCNENGRTNHDNTPNNLKWMSWLEYRQFTHKDEKVLKWNNTKSSKSGVVFDEYVWNSINKAICEFSIVNRTTLFDFINTEMIEHIIENSTNEKVRRNRSVSREIIEDKLIEQGYCSVLDLINTTLRENGIKMTYKSNGSSAIHMNDHTWNEIRKHILKGNVSTKKQCMDYINENLLSSIVNDAANKHTIKNDFKVTGNFFSKKLKANGFECYEDYHSAITMNHKVRKVEVVEGDDVYCMSVVGLNGEDDRHNFALRTFKDGNEWSEGGIFVSNSVTNDFFIPVREDNTSSPIETLPAAQNLTAMDDIKFIQNKVLTALRIPKSFLNFEENTGDGKNLSLLDIRFTRTVNRIQQALLMELNKIAIIHLYLLGFTDELTNFNLSMNNPSSQAEMLELDNLAKKITTAKDAVTDGGSGIPLMSMTRAWKMIMKWSDKEIEENLEELRLERALAAELEKTAQIIKKTGLFDSVDNIYGEPGAEYSDGEPGEGEEGFEGGGGGGSVGGGLDFGDDFEADEDGMETGADGEMDMETVEQETNEPPTENGNLGETFMRSLLKKNLTEQKRVRKDIMERSKHYEKLLKDRLEKNKLIEEEKANHTIELIDKNFLVNEELNSISNELDKIINK